MDPDRAPTQTTEPAPAPERAPSPGLWEHWGERRLLAWAAACLVGNVVAQGAVFALGRSLFLALAAGALLGVVLPTVLLSRLAGAGLSRDFRLGRVSPAVLGWTVLAAAAAFAPTALLADLSARLSPVPPEWSRLFAAHLPRGPGATLGAYAAVVLAAPLAEELVFRGLLQRLAAARWGQGAGIVLSALLFGLCHLEPWYLFGLVGVGLVLGAVHAATRSLTACVVAHGVHNAAALTLLLRQGLTEAPAPAPGPGDLLLAGASLPLLALALRRLARAARPAPAAAPSA